MGAWGSGLFQNDYALDLKDAISLVIKVPGGNSYVLDILKQMHPESVTPDNEDWTTFWIVVADQFEKRGLLSKEIISTTLGIIKNKEDLKRLEELELSKSELKKRSKLLNALSERLNNPRETKEKKFPKNPPPFCAEIGDVFSFPVSGFESFNAWFSSWEEAQFEPNGWGAFIVIDRGRAFDWLPWLAVASTNVPRTKEPTLKDVLSANLIVHSQTNGAAKCVPKMSHFKRLPATLIGNVNIDSKKAIKITTTWSEIDAMNCGWSISSVAINPRIKTKDDIGPVTNILSK
jgi:hypothetical protein